MGYSATATVGEVQEEQKRRSFLGDLFYRLIKEKPLGTAGAVIVLIFLFVAIFANFLAPHSYDEMAMAARLKPPSPGYPLGADHLGRDLLSRIIYGARISMYVGLGGAALNTLLAVLIGLTSGYFSGKTDIVLQRFVDAWMCFPPLFIMLTIMSLLGPGIIQVIIVQGMLRGIRDSRLIRSSVIAIKQNIYVEAGNAIGGSALHILRKHILPNIMATVIIVFTISVGYMITTEATLSFLGYGIPPPTPSWGGMLSYEGRKYMLLAPWMALWPGLALAIVVYGINMFGDALRDLLDPRLKGGLGRYEGVKTKRAVKKGKT